MATAPCPASVGMYPIPSYVHTVNTRACVIAIYIYVTVAAVHPFAGYPVSARIRWGRAYVNRLNRLIGYIIIACA